MVSVLDHNTILTTPPRWGKFRCTTLYLALSLIMFLSIRSHFRHWGYYLTIPFFAILAFNVFCTGINYTISKNGIVVNWLNIPLHKIAWDMIGHAIYLHRWSDPRFSFRRHEHGPVYGQIIYVTLKGCTPLHVDSQTRLWHNLLHPFHTACIWLPRDNKQLYIDLFAKYYPSLEVQPIDMNKLS